MSVHPGASRRCRTESKRRDMGALPPRSQPFREASVTAEGRFARACPDVGRPVWGESRGETLLALTARSRTGTRVRAVAGTA